MGGGGMRNSSYSPSESILTPSRYTSLPPPNLLEFPQDWVSLPFSLGRPHKVSLPVWCWAGSCPPLNLNFLICKMGTTALSPGGWWEDYTKEGRSLGLGPTQSVPGEFYFAPGPLWVGTLEWILPSTVSPRGTRLSASDPTWGFSPWMPSWSPQGKRL